METLSFIGILLALVMIIVGSMRSVSLIILSAVAAFVVAITGGISIVEGYAVFYMGGVGNTVVSLFPIFLGGQLFGKLLEKSGLTQSVANAIVRKMGTKGIVTAVFFATFVLMLGGVNVFVIIFTVYPMAVSFFKIANITRNIIPACVLGAAVSMQNLAGTPTNANYLTSQAFGVPIGSAPILGFIGCFVVGGLNLWFLNRVAKKSQESGGGFIPREGENIEINLEDDTLPNPLLIILPIATVIILLNVFSVPAWGALFLGSILLIVMFFKRIGNVLGFLNEAAKGSQSVISTAAIVGFGSIVIQVPGYQVILGMLEALSGGNPYIFAAIAVAMIAGVTGSATGGIQFVLQGFADKLVAMGGNPGALCRVISQASLTFDSLPHNSAIVLTLDYCGVSHKEGYKYLAFTTVFATTMSTVVSIILASMGVGF